MYFDLTAINNMINDYDAKCEGNKITENCFKINQVHIVSKIRPI